ncbi:hypothetical protein EnteroDNA1_00066 [Enterobacter sp. HK169]|nr:hypothetical protein EnteroDNA1_00066 [Enterobacter sp. HK169]
MRGSGRTEQHIAPGDSHPPAGVQHAKKSPHFHASSSLNMAVRGGLTRFARPAGRLFATLSVCPTGCHQLSNPGRGFSSPAGMQYAKKKSPHFHASSSSNMAVRGGIDSLRSPCGQTVRYALSLSNWLSPVVEPRSGILIPPQVCNMRKKSPHFHASSSLNMAVRGGLTRFARPAGRLFATLSVCPTGCRQLSNPGRGFSSPRRCATCEKKARIFMRALL